MSVTVIVPHISCICNEEDFENVKGQFSEIYIYTVSGILKFVKLKYDRYICLKVTEIPGQTSNLREALNFLPAGKVPYIIFQQIVAFFKKVIEVKKSSVEAHVHILWNPTAGYHLSVPNQRVSAASVTYDFSHIGKDDIIVADFHSHNSMGAFYSGTDENDDKNKTYYTGVIGKLNLPKYEYKLRFNLNELKHNCELDELFDIGEEAVEVPDAWLECIQTQTFGGKGKGKSKDRDKDQAFDPNDDHMYQGFGMGYGGESMEDWQHFLRERDNTLGKPSPQSSQQLLLEDQGENQGGNFHRRTRDFQEMRLNPKTGVMEPLEQNQREEFQENTQYIRKAKGVNNQDPCYMDYLTAQYGEETANGYDQAAAGLMDLDGCDEALLDLIREAYSRLTTSAQMELGQTGL